MRCPPPWPWPKMTSRFSCPKCLRGGTGPHPPTCTPEDRFWAKVEKGEGCWEWQGARHPHGYGQVRIAGICVFAHRYSWQLANGPIPGGLNVCHHCDNPKCVRPDHLFLGTQRDNLQDMAGKGRASRWRAELTHCKRGHPLAGPNLRIRNGERGCRECNNAARRKPDGRGPSRRSVARLAASR